MKALCLFLVLTFLYGCSKDQVESQEVKATIIEYGIGVGVCMVVYRLPVTGNTPASPSGTQRNKG